jgi:type 1 glutamine amidotransferase
LGRESGLFDTYIRTDTQLLTKQPILGTNKRNINARNLDFFDAIFFNGTGEGDLSESQKADLMSFVKDDGKGIVGAHTGNDAFFTWPEYGEMMGGYFDNHPWSVFNAPILVEDPQFPAMRHFPKAFTIRDEIYELKEPYSRSKVRVLARLDAAKLDFSKPEIHRTDKDFPVALAHTYGKGRVFWSTFGHLDEVWDNKDIQTMYLEAIKWAMKLTNADVTPQPGP